MDTNVILVANGQHEDVSKDCVAACALALQQVMADKRLAVDDSFEILIEYQNKTNPNQGRGPGDAFVKWALRNRANKEKCDVVPIIQHKDRGYESFPDDVRLSNFDRADRKFVAVAAAHEEHPKILQAADSKWIEWAPKLKDHGLEVEFLCPKDIKRFQATKAKK
ncbi:MAG: hypothetical protein WAW39_02540 [Prosthecobacter sp.]